MWVASTHSRAGSIKLENMDGFLWILRGPQSPRPRGDGTSVRPHKVSYEVSYKVSINPGCLRHWGSPTFEPWLHPWRPRTLVWSLSSLTAGMVTAPEPERPLYNATVLPSRATNETTQPLVSVRRDLHINQRKRRPSYYRYRRTGWVHFTSGVQSTRASGVYLRLPPFEEPDALHHQRTAILTDQDWVTSLVHRLDLQIWKLEMWPPMAKTAYSGSQPTFLVETCPSNEDPWPRVALHVVSRCLPHQSWTPSEGPIPTHGEFINEIVGQAITGQGH